MDNEHYIDDRRKVYALIADAHLSFKKSSKSFDGKVPPEYGNGVNFEQYDVNIFKRIKDLEDKGIVSEALILGDFLDSLQSQGINRLAYNPPTSECKDSNFVKDFDLYSQLKDFLRLKKIDNSHYFTYIIGNHDSKNLLIHEGIPFKEKVEEKSFVAKHGHQYDPLLKVLGLLPNEIFHRVLVEPFPDESKKIFHPLARLSKITAGAYGLAILTFYHSMLKLTKKFSLNSEKYKDGVEKYGFFGYRNGENSYLFRKAKEEMGDDKFKIFGHRHQTYLNESGIIIPELYDSGLSFMIETKDNFDFALGVYGPKTVKNYGKDYNKFFELAHLWNYNKKTKKWKYKGKIYDDASLTAFLKGSEFTSYEEVVQDGPFQMVQVVSQKEFQK